MNRNVKSKKNKEFINDKKLLLSKYRKKENKYLIYGKTLILEALKKKIVEKIYLVNDYFDDYNVDKIFTTKEIIKALTNNANVDVVAVCNKMINKINYDDETIILDNIQDPGNIGTIIRTAISFGYKQIILSENSVDIYSEKVLRSMQGANYNLNIQYCDLNEFIEKSNNLLITTYLDEKNEIKFNEKYGKINIIFGNEGHGINPMYKKYKRKNMKLDLNFESLNVSIAAAICMYEMKMER